MTAEFTAITEEWDPQWSLAALEKAAFEPIPPAEIQEAAATWLIPPLTNVYRAGGPAYIWLWLLPGGWRDLEVQECADDSIGTSPEWLDGDRDFESIMGYRHAAYDDESEFAGGWVQWGIESGIGPGQPFCIEVYPPTWHKTSYEYDEWDCEWEWNVVRVMPRSPRGSAASWGRFFESVRRGIERKERAVRRVKARRYADTSKLYISRSQWGRYDEKVTLKLCSEITGEPGWPNLINEVLFSAEDEQGSEAGAFEKLREKVMTAPFGFSLTIWQALRHPQKPFIKLSALPRKNARW
jgi:hypothetical protein